MIALLDSRSRYRPWRYGFGEAQMGDPVAIVLNTDPPCIIAGLATLGADGRPDRALFTWTLRGPGLLELTTLAVLGNFAQDPRHEWQLRGDAAIQLELVLSEASYQHDPSMRLGHSEIVQARILLHSGANAPGAETTSTSWPTTHAMCISIRSMYRSARRRNQSSERKRRRATPTRAFRTAAGCLTYRPTGRECCAPGAGRRCCKRAIPACWTSGSRDIRSARIAARSGHNGLSMEC